MALAAWKRMTVTDCTRTVQFGVASVVYRGASEALGSRCRKGSFRRPSMPSTTEAWQECPLSTASLLVLADLRLFLQGLRACSSGWLHSRLCVLEAFRAATFDGKPGPSYCPACRVLHPSCVQCLARLVFVSGHGFHHCNAPGEL